MNSMASSNNASEADLFAGPVQGGPCSTATVWAKSLDDLPIEVLQQIARGLDDISVACLILVNKRICCAIGTQAWSALSHCEHDHEVVRLGGDVVRGPARSRLAFLRLLATDKPNWLMCEFCHALHPSDLISRRISKCEDPSAPANVPLIVGIHGSACQFRIYPRSLSMVLKRHIHGKGAADSSCGEIMRRPYATSGDIGFTNFCSSLQIGQGRASKPGVLWTAKFGFNIPKGYSNMQVITNVMQHEFHICKHMVWEMRYQDKLQNRMAVNDYMFQRLFLGVYNEDLKCHFCNTKLFARHVPDTDQIELTVEKFFQTGDERKNSRHWKDIVANVDEYNAQSSNAKSAANVSVWRQACLLFNCFRRGKR